MTIDELLDELFPDVSDENGNVPSEITVDPIYQRLFPDAQNDADIEDELEHDLFSD